MDSIAKKYLAALKGTSIDSASLIKLPELKACPDWSKVEIVGTIDYVSERTKAHYKGILAKFSGGLYYINKNVIEAIGKIDKRFAGIKTVIKITPPPAKPVVTDEE